MIVVSCRDSDRCGGSCLGCAKVDQRWNMIELLINPCFITLLVGLYYVMFAMVGIVFGIRWAILHRSSVRKATKTNNDVLDCAFDGASLLRWNTGGMTNSHHITSHCYCLPAVAHLGLQRVVHVLHCSCWWGEEKSEGRVPTNSARQVKIIRESGVSTELEFKGDR